MKEEIEKAIRETLVIENPQSVWRAVDKIVEIVKLKNFYIDRQSKKNQPLPIKPHDPN